MHLLNQGCLENGITLEICTAYPRHALTALEMNSAIIVSIELYMILELTGWR